MKTKLYRVALWAVSLVGGIIVLAQNAGDLSDPTVLTAFVGAAITFVIVSIRQIADSTTPTLPPATP